jgi:hypothetical protein
MNQMARKAGELGNLLRARTSSGAPPSAECLGTFFVELRRPNEALAAFKQALAMAPNTLNSVNGAKQAALNIAQ